jgi:molybdopterin synthase sulfur carrier subunit
VRWSRMRPPPRRNRPRACSITVYCASISRGRLVLTGRPFCLPPARFRTVLRSGSFQSMPSVLPTVSVRVLLFASYAETLGVDALELSLDHPATVGDALRRIQALPGGERLPSRPLCALNLSQVNATTPLTNGDELALLPPMSGG